MLSRDDLIGGLRDLLEAFKEEAPRAPVLCAFMETAVAQLEATYFPLLQVDLDPATGEQCVGIAPSCLQLTKSEARMLEDERLSSVGGATYYEGGFRTIIERLLMCEVEPETVICSAIRLPDGHIFRGHRHDSCIRTAFEFVCWNRGDNPGEHHWTADMCRNQGFITSRNRYVDREEGLRLQLAAGIKGFRGDYRGQLYSEDCY